MDWIILTHGDCDGICAASLVLSANRNSEVFFTNPANLLRALISIESGNVIITDIALTSKHKDEIVSEFKRLSSRGRVIYLDHHPLPPSLRLNGLQVETFKTSRGACASELAYAYLKDRIEPEMGRVAVYGAIGDYCDNTPRVKGILEKWDKRELYLEAGILIAALEAMDRKDVAFKRDIVNYLSENRLPSMDTRLVEMAVHQAKVNEGMRSRVKDAVKTFGRIAYVVNIPWSLGKAAAYARAYGKAIIGVAAEEEGNNMDMSIRSIKLKNLNEMVASVAESLNGIGGGHANAAGAKVPKEFFKEFIIRLDKKISNFKE